MMSSHSGTEGWADRDGTTSTSTSLLARVRTQDPEAWRRLVRLYGPVVYEWCRQSRIQDVDAADVSQEVFVAVAIHMVEFRRDRPNDSFRGWLWRITRNKIADHFRRLQCQAQAEGGTDAQQRFARLPDSPPDDSSATGRSLAGAWSQLERHALELLRGEFQDRTWQAFWRMTIDGRSAADIGAELGMTKKAVRQAKFRVLRRLRQELNGLEQWGMGTE